MKIYTFCYVGTLMHELVVNNQSWMICHITDLI